MQQAITFPRIGIYTNLMKQMLEELGVTVILPPPITQNTIKFGVKYSSDFMCFPFKVVLGNLIEALEIAKNNNVRLTHIGVGYNDGNLGKNSCRFQHYFEIQKRILKDADYDLDMVLIEGKQIFKFLKQINPKNNYIKIVRTFWKYYKKAKELEEKYYMFDWNDKTRVRIGLVGEWYTLVANEINYDIYNKLKKMNVNVYFAPCGTLTGFLRHQIYLEDIPKRYIKEGKKYYKGEIQGHGKYSLWNMFFFKDKDFDGIFHFMPLSCMPESTVEMLMDLQSKKMNLPVYHFPIDEEIFLTGMDMRIKSIIRILERNKNEV